jgi:hypothetical protein
MGGGLKIFISYIATAHRKLRKRFGFARQILKEKGTDLSINFPYNNTNDKNVQICSYWF